MTTLYHVGSVCEYFITTGRFKIQGKLCSTQHFVITENGIISTNHYESQTALIKNTKLWQGLSPIFLSDMSPERD